MEGWARRPAAAFCALLLLRAPAEVAGGPLRHSSGKGTVQGWGGGRDFLADVHVPQLGLQKCSKTSFALPDMVGLFHGVGG